MLCHRIGAAISQSEQLCQSRFLLKWSKALWDAPGGICSTTSTPGQNKSMKPERLSSFATCASYRATLRLRTPITSKKAL